MSSLVENATIKIRRDSAANWTSNNPTPASGEWCLETDTGYLKIGDGSTAWDSLDYKIKDQTLIILDSKSSNTAGGTFTSGAWQTRDINSVEINTIAGSSINTNQITLPKGKYKIEASAPAYRVDRHQSRFYNITDAATVVSGLSSVAGSTETTQTNSDILGYFEIGTSKIFELQHRGQTTRASDGFGLPVGAAFTASNEVYSQIKIEKV